MKAFQATRWATAGATMVALLSACSWTGPNSVALPFTKGGGDDDLRVQVLLANATNLVPNAEVKYDEVTVGSVRKIELKDWTATLTIGLESDASIPANVTAKVAQKSLLGAEYLALEDAGDASKSPSEHLLKTGDVIGLDRTGRYPETEEVLAAASMLLNGGGIGQVRTITHELNAALTGRDQDIKSFMGTVATFTARLDRQRDTISTTLGQLDRLSRTVTTDRAKVEQALEQLPRGVRLLAKERPQLVRALRSLDGFSRVAHRVIDSTKVGFQQNLANVRKITESLAATGKKLGQSFDALSYPFPTRAANRWALGDYANVIATVEVNAGNIARDWLGGTPLDGLFTGLLNGTPTGPASQATNPLSGDLVGDLLGSLGLSPKAGGSTSQEAPTLPNVPDLLNQLLGVS